MTTLAGLLSAVLGFLKALIGPVTGWLLGRAQKDRDHAEEALDRLEKAGAAVDHMRRDPDELERLRDLARKR